MRTDIAKAIQELLPDAHWSCNANDYSQLVMHTNHKKPSIEALDAAYKTYRERKAAEPEPKNSEERIADLESKIISLEKKLHSTESVL